MDDVSKAVAVEVAHWVPYVIAWVVATIVYVIRNEGKMIGNERISKLQFENLNQRIDKVEVSHDDLENRHSQLQDRIIDKLSVIEKHLSKIEGRLSISDDVQL